MITNPLTRQVLNANPEGRNQYSGRKASAQHVGWLHPDLKTEGYSSKQRSKLATKLREMRKKSKIRASGFRAEVRSGVRAVE